MSNIKLAYVTPAALTLSLSSLANSATSVAGRQSTVIDNTANLYLDAWVGGKITSGTTPTVGTVIEVWSFAAVDYATPTYPDVLGATDAAVTFTARDIAVASMALVAALVVSANSNIGYWFRPVSVASLFGGLLPAKWGVVVINNTGVALHATGGNHVLSYTPVYATVI